ncbi:MAG: hypothetical protein R2791_17095 [Saprospiraceae bacterium]
MKSGERIIPFTKKDKRCLKRQLQHALLVYGLYLLSAILLLSAFFLAYPHRFYSLLAVSALVCFVIMLILCLFEKRPERIHRLLRDLRNGKKRVVFGTVDRVSCRQDEDAIPLQVYDVGPYRFELGQLSPMLRRFREVMPGQMVEVHQCLHSGIVLRLEAVKE